MKLTHLSFFSIALVRDTFIVSAEDLQDNAPAVEQGIPPFQVFENTGEPTDASERILWLRPSYHHAYTHCKGTTLHRGERLNPGESICARIDGEMVYYGVRSYPYITGYTMYHEEVWSEFGTFDMLFKRAATPDTPTTYEYWPNYIAMQGDGNLVVFGRSSKFPACRAKHADRGPNIRAVMGGPLPALMTVYDDNDKVLWSFKEMFRGHNGEKYVAYVGQSTCSAEYDEPKCVGVLHEGQRLAWNEFVCEYDENGNVLTRFGLSTNGLLGLWRHDELVWRPRDRPGWHLRGDYLRLQRDGHLTLFYNRSPKPDPNRREHSWASHCRGTGSSKLVVNDGNVLHFNQDGSMAWAVMGTEKPSPVCFPSCAD